jgi:hypothetical protein
MNRLVRGGLARVAWEATTYQALKLFGVWVAWRLFPNWRIGVVEVILHRFMVYAPPL